MDLLATVDRAASDRSEHIHFILQLVSSQVECRLPERAFELESCRGGHSPGASVLTTTAICVWSVVLSSDKSGEH